MQLVYAMAELARSAARRKTRVPAFDGHVCMGQVLLLLAALATSKMFQGPSCLRMSMRHQTRSAVIEV